MSDRGKAAIDEFDALYRETFSDVARYCRRRAASVADADDAVAATYKVAWEKFGEVGVHPHPKAWLYRAARNVLSNQRRTNSRADGRLAHLRSEMESNPARLHVADTAALAEQDADVRRLYRAIGELSDNERELIHLTAFEDLSHPQIAEVTGIEVAAVRSRIFRARNKLRQIVAKPEGNLKVDLREATLTNLEAETSGGPSL